MDRTGVLQLASALGIEIVNNRQVKEGWIGARCPFAPFLHTSASDAHPSFGLYVSPSASSAFNCYTCKQKGTVSSLILALKKYRGDATDYYDNLLEWVIRIELFGISVAVTDTWDASTESTVTAEKYTFTEDRFLALPLLSAHPYLISRGIKGSTTAILGVRLDAACKRVVFPVRDASGGFLGAVGRAYDATVQPKVKEYPGFKKVSHFIGENTLGKAEKIVLVEGLIDYARIYQALLADRYAGVFAVLGLLGSALSETKAKYLINADKPVIPLLDNDSAGADGVWGKDGVVNRLYDYLPVLLPPAYPANKHDPAELSYSELDVMLKEATMYIKP